MPRPCSCDRLTGPAWDRAAGDCWLCWLWHHSPKHRRAWGRTTPPPPARDRCRHLGRRADWSHACVNRCRHECDRADEPLVLLQLGGNPAGAVPGGACQTCPGWQPEAGPDGAAH